jgi:hypothetical protein
MIKLFSTNANKGKDAFAGGRADVCRDEKMPFEIPKKCGIWARGGGISDYSQAQHTNNLIAIGSYRRNVDIRTWETLKIEEGWRRWK